MKYEGLIGWYNTNIATKHTAYCIVMLVIPQERLHSTIHTYIQNIVFHWEVKLNWLRSSNVCVDDLTTNGSDNGLLPCRRQAIIRTNAGILLIEPLRTNFCEILIEILTYIEIELDWKPFVHEIICAHSKEYVFFTNMLLTICVDKPSNR